MMPFAEYLVAGVATIMSRHHSSKTSIIVAYIMNYQQINIRLLANM